MLRCHWRQNLGAKWTPVTRSLFSSTNHRASKDNHILQGNSSGLQQNTTHSCTKALTYMYLCMLAPIIKHWHVTTPPPLEAQCLSVSPHTATQSRTLISLQHTNRHDISQSTLTMKSSCTRMKDTCRQRLYATMVDTLRTWNRREKNGLHRDVNIVYVRSKALYIARFPPLCLTREICQMFICHAAGAM